MSWLMSAVYDSFMKGSEEACFDEWRHDLLAGVSGDVLEIGAGTGVNLRHYPEAVSRLVVAEPDRHMRKKLEARVRATHRKKQIEVSDASADGLPFADGTFDWVVSTLVLCSVPDLDRALQDLSRVLRPGGALVFLEHVASSDPSRFAWQRRVEPIWSRIAGNCHLTRRTGDAIRRAGFSMERETSESVRKSLPIARPSIRGIARKAS